LFWRRPSRRAYDQLRGQRDSARRQRDRLAKRFKRLAAELSAERNKPLLPPYGDGIAVVRDQPGDHIVWPERWSQPTPAQDPGASVAFVTVANHRFLPGLRGLLLSLVAVYPHLSSPFTVYHDGSLTRTDCEELRDIYSNLSFEVPSPAWAHLLPHDTPNRERIGILGYLNTYAFSLRGFNRVVVLDSDVLVFASLDPLWAPGDAFRACVDCGAQPYALVSEATGRPVINSGVISIPGWALAASFEKMTDALIAQAALPTCPVLDQFADQKIWNLLLADQPLELMPINLNCNIKYLVQFLGGCVESLSLVHFAGPKPWLLSEQPRGRSKSVVDHWLWIRHCRDLLHAHRLRRYTAYLERGESSLQSHGDHVLSLPQISAFVSDNPSCLLELISASGTRHLVLHDARQIEVEGDDSPAWPVAWRQPIGVLLRDPDFHLWAPFSLEHSLSDLVSLPASRLHYLLLELPFSAHDLIDQGGAAFIPYRGSSLASMRAAVERRLSLTTVQWLG
jgi:lipopolysaccharide biosynthesis glycosyltransferase